ncbi:MAG: ATP-binding protein [Thermanaerothrix sp.]|nr:ATP-binding protein [Thermanaerothrix sp.]
MALRIDLEDVPHPVVIFPPGGSPKEGNSRGGHFLAAFGWDGPPPSGNTLSIGGKQFLPVHLASLPEGEVFALVEALCAPKRDLFISQISHEIRNPLNNIIGMSEMCLSAESPNRRWLECIKEASSHLLRIANDLLDLSSANSDLELQLAPYEVRKLISNTVRFVAPMAEAKGLILLTKVSPSVPEKLKGDQDRVRQILLNLLTNAIKFSEHGSVKVEASVEGDDLVISVTDSGRGIPKEQLDKIFLPFYQASPSDRGQGRGLGLAICRKLAESMGGTITVKSAPGEGSSFSIKVPALDVKEEVSSPDEAPQRPGKPLSTAAKRPLNILLAEDDPLNRELVETALSAMGHRVKGTSTGVEALRAFSSQAFDLAILDVNMPQGDGVWLAREIRLLESKEPSRPRTPLIALTACATEEDRERCLKAGMDLFLTKPVPLEELRAAVEGAASGEMPVSEEGEKGGSPEIATQRLMDLSMGDREVMGKALTLFKEGVPIMLETLRLLLHRSDLKGAASVVHKLKGRFATVGHQEAAEYLATLEERLKEGQGEDPDHIINRINQATRQVLKAYEDINVKPL